MQRLPTDHQMRWVPFTGQDLRWLTRITGMLVAVRVLARWVSLPQLVQAFERAPRYDDADLNRLLWLTQGVLRRTHGRDFCMPRSLILFHFLSGWGYPVCIHFGVRRQGRALAGHAWVDLAGEPIGEAANPYTLYRTTYSYPSTSTEETYGHESDPSTLQQAA